MNAHTNKSILPWSRPLWLLVLAVMLVFGFYQQRAKVQLNHYIQVLQENPDVANMSPKLRHNWWLDNQQPQRIHYYTMEHTWSGFHCYSLSELALMKWALSIGILLAFFGLDALFLQTTGHFERWPWLMVMYSIAGIVMGGFLILVPGKAGYSVAHEFLAFLQSPLPSFLIVLVPSLFERRMPRSITKG